MLISLHSPYIEPGNLNKNLDVHINLIEECDSNIHVFPELSITGYNSGDLFFNSNYLNIANENLVKIHKFCKQRNKIAIVGAPFEFKGHLYNCAVVVGLTKIIYRAKIELCTAQEYYEDRWFKSGISINDEVLDFSKLDYDLSNTLRPLNLNVNKKELSFGIEICEDAWGEITPSMLFENVDVVFNLSASSDTIQSRKARKNMIRGISNRKRFPYLYVSGSNGESSSIALLRNIHIISDKSVYLEKYESSGKNLTTKILVDFEAIRASNRQIGRRSNKLLNNLHSKNRNSLKNPSKIYNYEFKEINSKYDISIPNYVKKPFHYELSSSNQELNEVFLIQVQALKKRLEHTNSKAAIVGVSGGIDSAYSLLILKEACQGLDINPVAVIMPSLGSSLESQKLAIDLAKSLNVDFKKIDISDVSLDVKNMIPLESSIANENIQARLRTTILMTLANDMNGIMVGTGTMSELAVGWCTYNADNMSMYNPNGGLPKTILIDVVKVISENKSHEKIIKEILKRPFTPELEVQYDEYLVKTTEQRVGLYSIIDFCLFYTLKYGLIRSEAIRISKKLFSEISVDELEFSINNFYDRFIPSQFKRTIIPDSPKIFSFDLSPRGCLRIPSDVKNPF
ncbi:NAD(+) synthase [Prochlorococcus sp. AH-716-D22]|nr:NAD(+) synthase [Prochlorococcus sp. AH-716-D22]